MLVNQKNRLKFINKAMRDQAPTNRQLDNSRPLLSTDGEFMCDVNEQAWESLEHIKDAGAGVTLRSALERNLETNTEGPVYRMTCSDSNKAFEVRIKALPVIASRTYKLAVVKDQTVYEELMRGKILEKYQRMLLSSISHEVRNPLHAIEGYRAVIADSQDVAEAKEAAALIGSAARQIDFIVAGACDLMLTESNTLITQPQPFEVRRAIQEVLNILRPSYEQRPVNLRISVPDNVADVLVADEKRYTLILYNLLQNAIKYTREGEISITLEPGPSPGTLTTTVADTGIGMTSEQLLSLFQLYANVEKANAYNPQGMGLGLTLCKRLAQMLGGDLSVTSTLGRGSSFTFVVKHYAQPELGLLREERLPVEGLRGERLQAVKPFVAPRLLTARMSDLQCDCNRVLIVDDERTNRFVLSKFLKELHVTADEAENGLEALSMVEKRAENPCCRHYLLILMDINMPVMDGTEATARLVGLFARQPVLKAPIVAVTAANLQSREDIKALLSVGFADVRKLAPSSCLVIKPVEKGLFLRRVEGYLGNAQATNTQP